MLVGRMTNNGFLECKGEVGSCTKDEDRCYHDVICDFGDCYGVKG